MDQKQFNNFNYVISFPHSPLAKLLYPAVDSNLLKFLYDDNQKVEPEWYIPIIPVLLVNGAEGIGTGWACKIPNYDPREIVNNINRMLNHQDPLPMVTTLRTDDPCTLSVTQIRDHASLWVGGCAVDASNSEASLEKQKIVSVFVPLLFCTHSASQLQKLQRGDP